MRARRASTRAISRMWSATRWRPCSRWWTTKAVTPVLRVSERTAWSLEPGAVVSAVLRVRVRGHAHVLEARIDCDGDDHRIGAEPLCQAVRADDVCARGLAREDPC